MDPPRSRPDGEPQDEMSLLSSHVQRFELDAVAAHTADKIKKLLNMTLPECMPSANYCNLHLVILAIHIMFSRFLICSLSSSNLPFN
jgi:hypothetical protein